MVDIQRIILAVGGGCFVFCLCKLIQSFPINRRCPTCGYQSSYSKWCCYDGTRMKIAKEIVKRCQRCRQRLWSTDKFCGNCGEKVENLSA